MLEFGREVHWKVEFISTRQIVFPLQINYWWKRDRRYRTFQNDSIYAHIITKTLEHNKDKARSIIQAAGCSGLF